MPKRKSKLTADDVELTRIELAREVMANPNKHMPIEVMCAEVTLRNFNESSAGLKARIMDRQRQRDRERRR